MKKNDFVLQKQCMPLRCISQYHNPTYLQDTHTIRPVECLIYGAYVFPKPRYFQQHPLKLQKKFNWTPFEAPNNDPLYPWALIFPTAPLALRLPKTSNCTH